jgi:hypothetical protein
MIVDFTVPDPVLPRNTPKSSRKSHSGSLWVTLSEGLPYGFKAFLGMPEFKHWEAVVTFST